MGNTNQPKPLKILNIAASQNRIMAFFFANRWAPGTLTYTLKSPLVTGDGVLFVEHGSCPMHPLKRSLGWSISIACLVPAILTTIFIIAEGFSLDGLYLILGITMMCGLGTAFVMLCLAWNFRILSLWPVVFDTQTDGIRVSLAHRQHWCMLNTLSPSLITDEFMWTQIKNYQPTPHNKLPDSLKNHTYACWLKLEYKTRKRWVLLALHDNENDASQSIIDWAQKLKLVGDNVFTNDEPPAHIFHLFNPKLW